jgi:hypothetical protein
MGMGASVGIKTVSGRIGTWIHHVKTILANYPMKTPCLRDGAAAITRSGRATMLDVRESDGKVKL